MYSACVEAIYSWRRLRQLAPCVLAVVALMGCSGDPDSPEAQIRDLIAQIETHVEAGEVRAVSDWLSADYRDRRHRNRRDAIATLFLYTRRHRDIHLFTLIQSIDVAPDKRSAQAVVDVAMTGKRADSAEQLAAMHADLYRFTLDLTYDSELERWQVASSAWRRAELGTVLP
jgi:uncharacterized protein (DUF2267 family)